MEDRLHEDSEPEAECFSCAFEDFPAKLKETDIEGQTNPVLLCPECAKSLVHCERCGDKWALDLDDFEEVCVDKATQWDPPMYENWCLACAEPD